MDLPSLGLKKGISENANQQRKPNWKRIEEFRRVHTLVHSSQSKKKSIYQKTIDNILTIKRMKEFVKIKKEQEFEKHREEFTNYRIDFWKSKKNRILIRCKIFIINLKKKINFLNQLKPFHYRIIDDYCSFNNNSLMKKSLNFGEAIIKRGSILEKMHIILDKTNHSYFLIFSKFN